MRAVKEVAAGMPEDEPNRGATQVLGWPGRTQQFLHDVRLEMRNVTWPSWPDVQATTLVVLVATFFFGFYLGMALDVPLAWVMDWSLKFGRELLR